MATMVNTSAEDKKKQLQRWFSDDEMAELSALHDKKEQVKVDHIYPNLYSQMSYAMGDIARFKNNAFEALEKLNGNSGDAVVKMLIKSIYTEMVTTLEIFEDDSDEFNFSRKDLREVASNTCAKIEAAELLGEAIQNLDAIRRAKREIDLAKKGVLI